MKRESKEVLKMREEYDIKNLNPRSNPYCYPAVFSYKDGEEISVVFPDLDVATSGVNDEDALLSAQELLSCVMYGLEEDDAEIPAPSSPDQLQHAANERIVLVEVDMTPIPITESDPIFSPETRNTILEGLQTPICECLTEDEVEW